MEKLIALIPLFWLLSPESLRLMGNLAGYGIYGIVFLAGIGLLSLAAVRAAFLSRNAVGCDVANGQTERECKDSFPRLVLEFAAVVGTTLFGSTGMLVTAGYTFNEVFYYRFPNFGFAVLLLVMLCIAALASERSIRIWQSCLLVVALACLVVLTAYGLMRFDELSAGSVAPLPIMLPGFLAAMLLFVACEQTGVGSGREHLVFVVPVYIFCIAVLAGWLFVSSVAVAPERLADSTIAHMTVASAIMGQPGRLIMGLVVIAGCCAAVSVLLQRSGQVFAKLLAVSAGSRVLQGLTIILGGIICGFMVSGLAGSDSLEIYLRGSLFLWLFYSGYLMASDLLRGRLRGCRGWLAIAVSFFYMGCSIYLAATDHQSAGLSIFLAGWLVTSALCIIVLGAVGRSRPAPDR